MATFSFSLFRKRQSSRAVFVARVHTQYFAFRTFLCVLFDDFIFMLSKIWVQLTFQVIFSSFFTFSWPIYIKIKMKCFYEPSEILKAKCCNQYPYGGNIQHIEAAPFSNINVPVCQQGILDIGRVAFCNPAVQVVWRTRTYCCLPRACTFTCSIWRKETCGVRHTPF